MSLYLKNSLSLTLKELNEAESRICFGISFQALAPWYPKDFLQYSRRSRGISKSSIFLVLYFEIFDLGVNLFLRFSGQSPFFILYVVISWSYFIRLRTSSQSHTQPSLCLAHSIDPFTERKASWVIGAYFDCSSACFKKLFHASHLGVPSNSGSYSLKISSKFMETTQHLPETQDFEILIAFSAWTLLNLCASFTNCALLRVSYSITSLYR